MTAQADPVRHIRPADRPVAVWLRAAAWLALGVVLLALPFAVILAGDPPAARGLTHDLSLGLGFAGLSLAGMQFALTGRIKPLLRPFGADIVVVFHRYLSWGVVALLLGHFGILYLWHRQDLGVLNPWRADPHMTAGRVALGCLVLLVASSELRKRIGLEYLWWRRLHVGLALAGFGGAIWHVLGAGHFTAQDATRILWLAVTLAWLVLMLWTRVLRPWRQARNPWRVIGNTEEGGGIRSLVLRPEGRPLRGWRPGQFAWLAVGTSPFSLREHPFTISTAPERGPELRFSIKPLGDDSRRISETPPGTIAHVDGPYGVFSIDRAASAPGFVMIAGGIGITPILANLHALADRRDTRPVTVIHANDDWHDTAFRGELDRLSRRLRLRVVHVVRQPPRDGWPPDGFEVRAGLVDAAALADLLPPETRDRAHMICGPAPMLAAVRRALLAMGVPRGHIDSDVFDLV
jgi:predicted ferric reductase